MSTYQTIFAFTEQNCENHSNCGRNGLRKLGLIRNVLCFLRVQKPSNAIQLLNQHPKDYQLPHASTQKSNSRQQNVNQAN